MLSCCQLCPRQCRINRLEGQKGFCQLGSSAKVASFHLHFGEERVLVGEGGSGTIFFSGCTLSCVYCQNYDISQYRVGEEVSAEELAKMMLHLQEAGAENINLVTPTPHLSIIVEALYLATRNGLKIPVVYNTSGFERVEVLRKLRNLIDIYLPDFKYGDDEIAQRLSGLPRGISYFKVAKKAISEMFRQVGHLKIKEGKAYQGVLVRHLVLPNDLAKSKKVFKALASIAKGMWVNVMDQYWPAWRAKEYPELSRRISQSEYQRAVSLARSFGLRLLD
ncbi:radical SAM protein [bacterium]|nr:radical SAM protein [bacterium]